MEDDSILDSSLLDELWGTVSSELAELGEEMESALLSLEQDPGDSEQINALFRAMHTYKSSSGMMGCTVTEALAHRSEDLVDHFRGKQEPLPGTVVELLFETVDQLSSMRAHVSEQRCDAPAEQTRDLIERLAAALATAGGEVVVAVSVQDGAFDEGFMGLGAEEFSELWSTVSDEMEELLYAIEEALLALENEPQNSELIGKLFRSMHTFKSSSGMMGLTVMEQIAHRSEDLVGLVRDQSLSLSEADISLLLEAMDRLQQLHQHAGDTLGDGNLAESQPLIDRLLSAFQQRQGGGVETPTVAPEEEDGFGFFAPETEATSVEEEDDGFGFFEPEAEEIEEDGFGFFSNEKQDAEEDDGFGFFPLDEAEESTEEDGFGFFEEDHKDIWELTVEETRENLDEIESALLSLEQQGDAALELDRLFRAIHTIKGTANVMGLLQVEALYHRCEDLVGLAREGQMAVSQPMVSLLLKCTDLIRGGLDRILQSKSDLDEQEVAPLIEQLQQFQQGGNGDEAGESEQEDPAADPLYVQIFVEMGWESLERLNGGLELLAGDPSQANLQQFRQELEELQFAAERMGYHHIHERLQQMMQQDDVQLLNDSVGWIGGQLTELEELLQTGLSAASGQPKAVEAVEVSVESAAALSASDDDFFGGDGAFDEAVRNLPPAPDYAAIDSEDEVDPVFSPLFVQDFLEKQEEQLVQLRTIAAQPDMAEPEKREKLVALLKAIESDARKMGYDHLIAQLEYGKLWLQQSQGENVESILEKLELALYEELTAIQEAIPDLERTATGAPIDISWVFRQTHAEQIFEVLAQLLDLVSQLEQGQGQGQVEEHIERFLRSIHHAAIFYQLKTAAGLSLSLADFYSRVTQHELKNSGKLLELTREFVRELGMVIDSVQDGEPADQSLFESMMREVENLLYLNSGTQLIQSAKDVLEQLDLPEDFFEVFTPDSLQAVGSALDRGDQFYIIHTDMDQNEVVAAAFYRWSQMDEIEIITNFTVLHEDRSLFDFLIASPWSVEQIEEGLVGIDPSQTLLRLRDQVLRTDTLPAAVRSETAVATATAVGGGSFSTAPLMESVGDLVSVQAMLHHVTHALSKSDLLERVDQAVKAGEEWKEVRELLQDEMEQWKRQSAVLGQLESEIGVTVGRMQELVHEADAVTADYLTQGVAEWLAEEAARGKKSVRLSVEGERLEVEQRLLDNIRAPLRQLLLVALGSVEPVVERMERGKSSTAEIRVVLRKSYDRFEVTIEDDGAGFEQSTLDQRRAEWRESGQMRQYGEQWLLQDGVGELPFHDRSGSVDLAPIRAEVESMGGNLRITTVAEEGLRIRLLMPLSMAVINGLVVRIGGVRYVVPVHFVRRIVQVNREQLVYASADGGREMLHLDGDLIPLKLLAGMTLDKQQRLLMVVVELGEQGELVACPVDELVDQQQVMIRPLKGVLSEVQDASGIAVLGDGDVGVVLRLDTVY